VKTERAEFILQMLRGFVCNFDGKIRAEIVQYVISLSKEVFPAEVSAALLDCYFEPATRTLQGFKIIKPELSLEDMKDSEEPPIVRTVGLQRDLAIIRPWVTNCEPLLVCGPEGSGKGLLIKSALDELRKEQKVSLAVIYCNAQTSAAQIIQKLNQITVKQSFALGRILRPKDCSRLVLYFKDINLPKPDRY